METVPSENILALRKLSEKLSKVSDTENYQNLIQEIKNVVEEISLEIEKKSTPKEKVKCYDKMCVTITNLLEKLN
jgi:hypothetical protein